MKSNEELLDFLQRALPSELVTLKQMVAINSFTANQAGVNELARFTAKAFADLGFTADYVAPERKMYGDHLVMTRKGRSNRTVGLISHLDTVFPPEEEKRNNFAWREEGHRIYGPGVMDIKGGTSMIHLTLAGVKAMAPDVFEEITWVVLLDSSEETYSVDFGALCCQRLPKGTLAALVFEAGMHEGNQFLLVTARKGRAVFRINVEGCGAHAGSHHERGANAIVQISDTIKRVAALTDYSKDLTFNVGSISGGTVVNRVPHHATADVEMRAFSVDVYNEAVKAMLGLNGEGTVRAAETGQACRVSVELIQESPPWPRNECTKNLFNVWQETGKSLGFTVLPEERGGLSDGNFICHHVPTLDGMGPNGDNAHCSEQSADGSKVQEYMDVRSIVPKAALNTLAILKLAEQSK